MTSTTDTRLQPLAQTTASFHPPGRRGEPLLRDWLVPHRDALFRWALAQAGDALGRRALAEVAVAVQRLRGAAGYRAWLYGAAVQAAAQQAGRGGLGEASLAGLAPELRAVLRLVARADLRPEEATALLAQRMGYVRGRLVRTRLRA